VQQLELVERENFRPIQFQFNKTKYQSTRLTN